MALDRTKVLETAQKYLAKGQYDKAIVEYQKLVREDPNDVRTWLKIGDLYTRKGSRPEACDTYLKVAKQYADQGFFLKAVAVYKQILKLDPSRLDVSLALADMYEQLQLVSDALSTYEVVAAGYARNGDVERALETIERMTHLDPDNIPVRIKYAEALSKANRTTDAAVAFEAGARLLKEQGRMDDYIKVAERLLFHRPTDANLARELAELYLEREDPKRALGKLQLSFKADPRHVPTLELLAGAFALLGQTPKTISVYKEIARIHHDGGRTDDRARILKRILELDPGDAEARQAIAGYAGPAGAYREPAPTAVVAPRRAAEDDDVEVLEEEDDDVLLAEEAELLDMAGDEMIVDGDTGDESEDSMDIDVDVAVASPPSDGPPKPATPSIPPDVAREAQIARLLTECDVFARYGLKAKVLDQLQRVIEIAPDHIEARERLKDAYLEQGRKSDAIAQLYALARLFEGDSPHVASVYYTQVFELDPTSEPAATHARALKTDDRTAPETTDDADDDVMFLDDDSIAAAEDQDEIVTMDGDVPPVGKAPVSFDDETIVGDIHPDAAAPVVPSSTAKPVLNPISPEEFEAVPIRASSPGDVAASVQRASLPPGEVEEILDEAEFFLAQGLVSEARSTLQEALSNHPDHPLLLDKISELAEMEIASSSRPKVPTVTAADDSFLLAEKLAEELGPAAEDATDAGSDVLDVEQVFAQFKKGVEEQIGLEDSDTHFDLGIAYKEMGLLDDAVHEFELAKANPQRECIALTMIGLCHVEKGEIAEAIARFKKGLYADNKTDREELGLYFELGAAYELLHDPKEALYYYQKVQKRDARFRNVEARVRKLTSPKAPPTPAQAPTIDDVDRAFDDLMGED